MHAAALKACPLALVKRVFGSMVLVVAVDTVCAQQVPQQNDGQSLRPTLCRVPSKYDLQSSAAKADHSRAGSNTRSCLLDPIADVQADEGSGARTAPKFEGSSTMNGQERLDAVTVTGKAVDQPKSIEAILQRSLALPPERSGNLVSHPGAAGTRYECYERCTGFACCVEVRTMPNPARESNAIGR